MKSSTRYALVVPAALAAIGILAVAGTISASASPAAAPAAPTVTAGARTAAESARCPQLQCAPVARAQRMTEFAPAQPVVPGRALRTKASVVAGARSRAETTAARQRALPVTAIRTTMAAADRRLGIGSDPLIAPDRPVFLVTVHGDMSTDSRPGDAPQAPRHVFTDIVDAPSGQLIVEAIGVDAFAGQHHAS